MYSFLKNLQGDVVALVDDQGDTVARYSYDAWGVPTVLEDHTDIQITRINPFLYRGYYYDHEIGMYYLQSRYYDPQVGRFINADIPEFCIMPFNLGGHNLMSYCFNALANCSDPMGTIALVDDLLILAFIALCVTLIGLVAWMSTSEFQKSWANFCTAVGNGLTRIGSDIARGGAAARNWTRKQLKVAKTAIVAFTTIAIADTKIHTKVKKNSKQRYWAASIQKVSGATYVVIYSTITYTTAKSRVASGLCVFAVTKNEARTLASNFPPIVGPEKGLKDAGQYWHYHVKGRKSKSHIFYMF